MGICKIGIFGTKVDSDANLSAFTITEDSWSSPTVNFNLVTEASKVINTPTISTSPTSCHSTPVWQVLKASDQSDITEKNTSSTYILSPSNWPSTFTVQNGSISDRLTIYGSTGSQALYFVGTTQHSTPQTTQ